jgi:hypothetical protein
MPLERRGVHDCADGDEDCTARHRGFGRPRLHPRVFQTAAPLFMTVLEPARIEHDSAHTDRTGTKSHQASTRYPSLHR